MVYKDIGQFWKCDKDNNYRWNKLYTDRKMRQEETEILYREVGAWSARVDKFKQYKNRIIDNFCIPVVIEKDVGISINTEDDFYYAEYLIKQYAPQVFKEIGLYKLHGDKPPAQERQSSLLNIRLEETYAQQKDNIKNEDVLKKALELNPGNDRAYDGLGGWLYLKQGQFQQVEECFKKALELNPGNYRACVGLGWLYLKQGQFQQAEECFKKALELNPGRERSSGAQGR